MSKDSARPGRIPPPVVRHFVPCQKIERGPDGRMNTLIRVTYRITLPSGMTYPRTVSEMWFYSQIVEGRGDRTFQLKLERFAAAGLIDLTIPKVFSLGDDPVEVREVPIQVKTYPFPTRFADSSLPSDRLPVYWIVNDYIASTSTVTCVPPRRFWPSSRRPHFPYALATVPMPRIKGSPEPLPRQDCRAGAHLG
jgi:hypothetical protein